MKTMFFKVAAMLVLLACASVSEAQITKGMKRIGGSLALSYYNSNQGDSLQSGRGSSSSFSVSPTFGYFLTDKICVGLAVPFSYSNSNTYTDYSLNFSYYSRNTNIFYYGFNPYVRYYMGFSEKFYGFLNAGAEVDFTKTKEKMENKQGGAIYYGDEIKSSGLAYSGGLNFGLTYFVTPTLALETTVAGLNYRSRYLESGVSSYYYNSGSSFNFGLFPSGISLGLNVYLK